MLDPAPRRLLHCYERPEPAPFETGPRAEPRGVVQDDHLDPSRI